MRKEAVIIEKDGTRHIGAAKDPGWRPDPALIAELEEAEQAFTARLWIERDVSQEAGKCLHHPTPTQKENDHDAQAQ
jgi:hypothetical protein